MADWNDNRTRPGLGTSQSFTGVSVPRTGEVFDAGLRRHMLSIYNYMTSGVLLTGLVAMLFARSGMAYSVMTSGLGIVVMLAPLAIVFAMSFGQNRFGKGTLQAMFWAFAVLMGTSCR